MDWNLEQIEKTIKELDKSKAKFLSNKIGNEVVSILNATQDKLKNIYLHETDTED